MFKVYKIDSDYCYGGISLVAANNAEEANEIIRDFKENDVGNACDSKGYESVCESDVIEGLHAEDAGIVYYGIHYTG